MGPSGWGQRRLQVQFGAFTGVLPGSSPFLCLSLPEALGLSSSVSLPPVHTLTPPLGACWRLSWQPSSKIIKTLLLTVVPDEVLILSEAEAVGRMLKSLALCGGPAEGESGLQQEVSRGQEAGPPGKALLLDCCGHCLLLVVPLPSCPIHILIAPPHT